jgi:hypothetical protein
MFEHIDPPKKDFCLLAAIGLILRQFPVASCVVSRRFVRRGLPKASSDLATEYTRFKKS